jgi:hypothetical protein
VNKLLDESKVWITAVIADVTKDILQYVWQDVDNKWDVCRVKDGAHFVMVCIE